MRMKKDEKTRKSDGIKKKGDARIYFNVCPQFSLSIINGSHLTNHLNHK